MKILHFVDSLSAVRGGPVRAVLDLAAGASAAGHEVTVATLDVEGAPPDAGAPGGPRIVVLPGGGRWPGLLSHPAEARLVELLSATDVLHLHGVWELATAQAAACARRRGVPYVVSTHGMLDRWPMRHGRVRKRLYLALIGRRLLGRAACVHCTASVELEESRRWFGRTPARVIPLVIDLSPFRGDPGPAAARERCPAIADGRPVVLFLGRLDPIKGLESLLEAAGGLRTRGMDITVVLAGPGDAAYEASLRAESRRHGIADRVEFIGAVFGADKVSLYQSADALVLPSLHENFGLVAFEALAAGLPVLVSRAVASWPDLQASGGAVIAERTPEGLANALVAILADPAARRAMGEAGRRWTFDTMDASRVIPRYIGLYSEAVAQADRAAGAGGGSARPPQVRPGPGPICS